MICSYKSVICFSILYSL